METDNLKKAFVVITEGYSMYPKIKPGAKVLIVKVPIPSLKKGDIILVYKDSIKDKFLHRIVKIEEDDRGEKVYYLRGDNSIWVEKINKNNILGKALLWNNPPFSKKNFFGFLLKAINLIKRFILYFGNKKIS